MKTEQATVLIAQALLQDGVSNQPKELAELLTIPVIQIHGVMNRLNKDGLIEIGRDEKGKTYSIKNPDGLKALAETQTDESGEPETEQKGEVPKQDKKAPKPVGRHTGKVLYNKVSHSKSACALKVVTDYIEKEQPSLKQLKTAFPDDIVSRFGVVAELKTAQNLSKDRARYHLREHQVLTTSDGKKVVVTNQWTEDRFVKFREFAEKLGYQIKPE